MKQLFVLSRLMCNRVLVYVRQQQRLFRRRVSAFQGLAKFRSTLTCANPHYYRIAYGICLENYTSRWGVRFSGDCTSTSSQRLSLRQLFETRDKVFRSLSQWHRLTKCTMNYVIRNNTLKELGGIFTQGHRVGYRECPAHVPTRPRSLGATHINLADLRDLLLVWLSGLGHVDAMFRCLNPSWCYRVVKDSCVLFKIHLQIECEHNAELRQGKAGESPPEHAFLIFGINACT